MTSRRTGVGGSVLLIAAGLLIGCAAGVPAGPVPGDPVRPLDQAVLRGMAWMERFIDRDSNREELGTDPALLFLEIAASSVNARVRARALAAARRYAEPTARELLSLKQPLGPTDTVDLIELLADAAPLGLDAETLRARARSALSRYPDFESLYGLPFAEMNFATTQELFDVTMSVYSLTKAEAVYGEEFRVRPGIAEVLDFLSELPFVSAKDDPSEGREVFRDHAYLVTHVAYMLSDYNRIRLERDDAPWLYDYLRENFDAVLRARDVELVAEFVDVFRSLGGTEETDADVRAGTEFLLAAVNPDGSWGPWGEQEDAYDALHFTWCAVCALREREFLPGSAYGRLLRRELLRR